MRNWIYFLLAIAGIFLLYFISSLQKPVEIELEDLWKYNGKKVIVRGIVKNKIGNLFEISDGEARTKIYFDGNIEYGDEIKAIGKVGEYGDEFVVYVDEIEIINKWNKNVISLPYLAENYEKFVGLNVNLTGYIYSIYSKYFYLTDEYINYKIKVYYNETINFSKGDKVYVNALFLYNSKNFNFYLICKKVGYV